MSVSTSSVGKRADPLNFDPIARVVDVAGRKTLLDARSSRVLLILTEHFGECVSKDTLMRAGWPTQLVHENSLAKAISKLRRAIDGSGMEIAAAYGVGYTLRDSVLHVDQEKTSIEPHLAAQTRPRPRAPIVLVITICAVLLTVAVVRLAAGWVGEAASPRRGTPITNDPPNSVATILWVDDHPSNNALEVDSLRRRRVAVHLTKSTDDALKLLGINRYDLVVSDLGRGEDRLAGLKMIDAMKHRGMTVPVIIYTVRPKDRAGQEELRRLSASAGAKALAVTPEEVRASISGQLAPAIKESLGTL